jgi:hypothetical protein
MALWWKVSFLAVFWALSSVAWAAKPDRNALATSICTTAVQEAKANNLDPAFFARLLWKESLFDPNVVSPKGAQGIAQFMPETAKLRGLEDPFEPISAVKASAAFLSDLRDQFGNLGLAAAAYNAGEKRVGDWQQGKSSMPLETQDYVQFITGRDVNEWKEASASFAIPAIGKVGDFTTDCVTLALRKTTLSNTATRSAPRQPWGVVLAVNFNERTALSIFQRLKLRFPKLIANRQPMIARKRNLSRGTRRMVFVMLGEKTAEAAQATCGNLSAAGAPCLVRRN